MKRRRRLLNPDTDNAGGSTTDSAGEAVGSGGDTVDPRELAE